MSRPSLGAIWKCPLPRASRAGAGAGGGSCPFKESLLLHLLLRLRGGWRRVEVYFSLRCWSLSHGEERLAPLGL